MKYKSFWLLASTSFVLTACGSSGTADSGIAVVNSPSPVATPTSSPTPPPAPAPVTLTFPSVSVAILIGADGSAQVYPAVSGQDAGSVTISDPDAPSANSFEDLRRSGNETLSVSRNQASSSYSASFSSSNALGSLTTYFYDAASTLGARVLTLLRWTNGSGATLQIAQTQAEAVAVPTPNSADFAQHARLIETTFADRQGLQVTGNATAASAWPHVNGLRYVGEAYGTVYTASHQKLPFVGDAEIYVDAANGTSQLHGIISVRNYLGQGNSGLPVTVEVVGDIVGNTIVTRELRVDGAGGMVSFGSLSGAFYGASGNELGLVFSAAGQPGSMIGGLVLRLVQ